jgi:hypothetical protein
MYTVVAGDTCQSIAANFNVPVEDLIAANGLPVDCSTLQVNQTLTVQLPSPSLPKTVEGLRGLLSIAYYNQPDGTQRVEYSITTKDFPLIRLEGDNLEPLQKYHNRPVNIWGVVDRYDTTYGWNIPIVKVDHYELPFPDVNFEILKGTQRMADMTGHGLFIADEGKTYIMLDPYGALQPGVIAVGNIADPILVEALIIPDETAEEYPAIRIFSAKPAFDPVTGQAATLEITADRPITLDEPRLPNTSPTPGQTGPTMTIEKVELVYYITDPRYSAVTGYPSDPAYVQPMWRFYGHYSNGDEFEFLVQALKDEFLSPVIQTVQPPG